MIVPMSKKKIADANVTWVWDQLYPISNGRVKMLHQFPVKRYVRGLEWLFQLERVRSPAASLWLNAWE